MGPQSGFDDILLVEDNPGDVRLTRELLKNAEQDPTLHVVSDGDDALSFLRQTGEYRDAPRPDAILLDLHLPRMDGEEVLRELDEGLRDIPTIVLSGSQQGADLKLDDVEADVDACIEKPLSAKRLDEFARARHG
ncbi:response regulator [Natronolimnohabitans innermongolicus]|uniref:Response regulator receiver protein n=1 Tax=Natronolimnohabitans innermongolicus JCM 12255 TaxID=1227499 RepID=L9WND0_9EURY|nr:response regulator [Natronolimnohabitans innermongolicus]ELY50964.1 response regulator receiver protein [Natronolimnohabitans innermongolicus JCM 12255]